MSLDLSNRQGRVGGHDPLAVLVSEVQGTFRQGQRDVDDGLDGRVVEVRFGKGQFYVLRLAIPMPLVLAVASLSFLILIGRFATL